MLCAHCEVETTTQPCHACGREPRLAGRYAIESVIGRGAAGRTYRARTQDSKIVAAKELPWRSLDNLKTLELFRREAAVLRQLDHPGIPRYIEDFTAGEGRYQALWIIQALIPGQTLEQELSDHRYDESEIEAVGLELLNILDYLHSRRPPVIHRDLKPANVIRRPDGRLVLIDFGAVRDALKDEKGGSTVIGTFGYMAPEQLRGEASPATDLYGLGALLLNLLTRKDPATLFDHQHRLLPGSLRGVSPHLTQLIERLLDPEPKKRPDLEAVRRFLSPAARPLPVPVVRHTPVLNRPWVWLLAGLAIASGSFVFVALGVVTWKLARKLWRLRWPPPWLLSNPWRSPPFIPPPEDPRSQWWRR